MGQDMAARSPAPTPDPTAFQAPQAARPASGGGGRPGVLAPVAPPARPGPDAAAGTAPALEVTAGPADRRAFVRFDVAGCSIPAGAEVRSAALAMVLAAAPAEARNWKVQRVTDAWAGDVTWSTAPAVAAASTDTAATGIAAGATLQWNVLPDVADVVSGAALDRGWRIADADETPVAPVGGALASSEAAAAGTRPTLTVTWFD